MLDFDLARALADGVLAEDRRRRTAPLTVAVLDAGGHAVVLYRQDGAGIVERFPGFVEALSVASEGRLIPAAGGVLLRDGTGRIIGAVGVSGDGSDVDEACAVVAARAVGLDPEPSAPSA